MIEVESKISISKPEKFRKLVRKLGKYKGKKKKIDEYYTTDRLDRYTKKRIRIRKLDGHYEINIKKDISYKKNVHAKKEVELVLNPKDFKKFLEIIENQGYRVWIKKIKTSEIYEIKKNFTIELNKVEKLGWFIEIEYLVPLKNIKKARNEVDKIIKKLGVNKKYIIKKGYTKMIWEKAKRAF